MKYDGNSTFDKDGVLVENLLGEEWAAWPRNTYQPKYQVSTAGRIRRIIGEGWRLMNPTTMPDGNITIVISIDSKRMTRSLKKLIAEVWVKNLNNLDDVLTINGLKHDLRSCNLTWHNWRDTRNKISRENKQLRFKIAARIKSLNKAQLLELDKLLTHL